MKTLDEIAVLNRTDKASNGHNYTRVYDCLFSDKRIHPVNLLEIGVLNGGSIKTWAEYFMHKNSVFTGIDINTECMQYQSDRITIEIGDQSDPTFMELVGEQYGKFDIVIDDGLHILSHQKLSFQTLWKHINPEGFFICEDTHTSYGKDFELYRDNNSGGINFYKTLIDEVNGQFFKNDNDIDYIQFYNSLVIIKKKGIKK